MNRKSSINNSNNRLLYDPNHDKERRLGTFSMQEDLDEEETPEEAENTGEDSIEETPESNENIKDNDGQSETKEDTNSTRKEVAKTAVKEGAKQAGKAAGKAATKATGAVAAKIGALIAANPWILVVIVIIQFLEGNFLQPLIMSKTTKLHPVTIILGLLVFGYFFGIVGMLISTPVIAALKTVFKFYDNKYGIIEKDEEEKTTV